MEQFGYFRSIYLKGVFEYLDKKAIPYEKSKHYLKHFELGRTESDTFLPTEKVLKWIDDVADSNKLYCLSYEAASKLDMSYLSETTIYNCSMANNLEEAIVLFSNSIRHEGPLLRMWVTLDENGSAYRVHIDRTVPSSARHYIHSEWLNIWLMIKMVRAYLGEDWLPSEIGFQSFSSLCNKAKNDMPQTKLIVGVCSSYIRIERHHLSAQPFLNVRLGKLGIAFIDKRNKSVKDHLKTMLKHHLSYRHCGLESCAAVLGMSVRSFQRKLKAENTSFREVVLEYRINKAQSLLKRTNMSINAISKELGYSASTHFIRSFRNELNTTPEQYRASFANQKMAM